MSRATDVLILANSRGSVCNQCKVLGYLKYKIIKTEYINGRALIFYEKHYAASFRVSLCL